MYLVNQTEKMEHRAVRATSMSVLHPVFKEELVANRLGTVVLISGHDNI